MECARRQLLAGARFTTQEHDLGVWREPLNQAEDFLHDRTASEHAAEFELLGDLALERHHLRAPLELHANVDQHIAQTIEVEGLGEVFARAEFDRLDGTVDRGVRGHQNDFAARHVGANLPKQIEAVHVRHAQIDHREVGRLAHQNPQRLGAARAGFDIEPCFRREPLDHL